MMTDQERITALELRVENHFQSALRLGQAITRLTKENQDMRALVDALVDELESRQKSKAAQ